PWPRPRRPSASSASTAGTRANAPGSPAGSAGRRRRSSRTRGGSAGSRRPNARRTSVRTGGRPRRSWSGRRRRLGGQFEPEEGPGLLRIEFADAEGGAQCGERAGAAGGSAGMADAASVEDHSVREDGEFLLREQGGDVVLGLDRVGLLGPAE